MGNSATTATVGGMGLLGQYGSDSESDDQTWSASVKKKHTFFTWPTKIELYNDSDTILVHKPLLKCYTCLLLSMHRSAHVKTL